MTVDAPNDTITIDLFEDFPCPWCRIGRANLAKALAQWEGAPVEVRHRPFMLDPTIPPEGNDFRAHMNRKFGDDVEQVHEVVREAGARAGLTFRFDLIRHAPNSLRAHRLVELAPAAAKNAVAEEVFERYFALGEDIGSIDVLADVAGTHGMERNVAHSLLTGDDATVATVESMREAQRLGISGVPFFVIANQYGVSGAQSPDTLLQVLRMVEEGE